MMTYEIVKDDERLSFLFSQNRRAAKGHYLGVIASDGDVSGCLLIEDFRDICAIQCPENLIKDLLCFVIKFLPGDISCLLQKWECPLLSAGFIKSGTSYLYQRDVALRFRDYAEVAAFINSQPGRVYSLAHFAAFMASFGNPQYALTCVHIGGTNGKGSTTNYVKSVMLEAGYHVGMFTSPAMISRTEVIRCDDVPISDETMVYYASRYMDDWLTAGLSMFEIEMFIAVMYYLEQGVDFALFEVGLGGTLDATNIIHPLLAVNTNIGLDHIDYLGDSYESIARNKAGIIKDGVAYMTAETREVCLNVFKEVTQQHHSELIVIAQPENVAYGDEIAYDYRGYHVRLNTQAAYQVANSALAINILDYIKPQFPFTPEILEKGLYQAQWAGRFEKLSDEPLIIVDGAHNKEGMAALYASAIKLDHPHIIFTALRDKDTKHMLEILLKISDDVTITQFDHYRRATAVELAGDAPVVIDPDWHHAVDEALAHHNVILITGSLYFIAQVRPYILEKLGH